MTIIFTEEEARAIVRFPTTPLLIEVQYSVDDLHVNGVGVLTLQARLKDQDKTETKD